MTYFKEAINIGKYQFTREVNGNRVSWSRNRLPEEGGTLGRFREFGLEESEIALAEEVLRLRRKYEPETI